MCQWRWYNVWEYVTEHHHRHVDLLFDEAHLVGIDGKDDIGTSQQAKLACLIFHNLSAGSFSSWSGVQRDVASISRFDEQLIPAVP